MIRYVKPPFDPPKPNDLAGQLAEAIRLAAADLAGRKETGLGHVISGCDGYPIVTIGDGTTCHDSARASQGGALVLTADLGGSRATLQANLGRSQSPNSGYGGAGLSSGAIPPPLDAGAADISLSPVDQSLTVDIIAGADAGGTGDPLLEFIGATISGKTGDSKRLAVCYEAGGAGIWDDILLGSETAITGLSINPNYVGALGGEKYALTELYENIVSLVDAGAETGTTDLPVYTGTVADYAYSAVAISRDLDTMAVLVNDNTAGKHGIYIGTSMLTTPSWASINLNSSTNFQVYGTRSLAFDGDGNLWVAAQTLGRTPKVLVIASPYTSVTYTLTPSWAGGGTNNDPCPLAISRNGVYVASAVNVGSNLLDIWSQASRAIVRTIPAPSGYTREYQYGGIAWGPDGRLFAVLRRIADDERFLAVWTDTSLAPELIDLGISAMSHDWVSVSGDGEAVAVQSWTDELKLVEPPYTAAGATVSTKTMTADILYQFEFDPSEVYTDSSDLTLSASVTSAAGSGSSVTVVTRLSWAAAAIAWAVTITVPLPEGSTFVSATDDGSYDAETGLVTWFVGTVAASASGYVEMTTTSG